MFKMGSTTPLNLTTQEKLLQGACYVLSELDNKMFHPSALSSYFPVSITDTLPLVLGP